MANASIPPTFASMCATTAPTRFAPWADDQVSPLAHGSGRLPARGQDADWRPLHLRARPVRPLSSSLKGLQARANALPVRGVA